MYIYKIIESKTPEIEGIIYDSFGVVVFVEKDENLIEVATVHDIFLNKNKAEDFVNKCNSVNLSPLYLMDKIENVLTGEDF